jgi:ribonuclease D
MQYKQPASQASNQSINKTNQWTYQQTDWLIRELTNQQIKQATDITNQ